MILETHGVGQELVQEDVGRRELNGAVTNASILMEMLPESAPVVPPPRSVRHKGKVEFRARPAIGRATHQSPSCTVCGIAVYDVQLDHHGLLPV